MKENTKSCRTFVIKIAECCNIACKYCYMFKSGDSSFLDKPKFMSPYIARKAIQRAKEHCEHHDIPVFNLILHGGEPLLAGIDFVDEFVQMAKEIFKDSKTKVVVGVQTNGTLIDDKWCEIFKQDKINVGISLDGIKKYNDAFRVDRKGHGTFERIVKGIRICKRNGVEPGILSVINPNCDPLKLYELYKSLNVKGADVLLLEANYDKKPPKVDEGKYKHSKTPYGDWLIDFFDIWYKDDNNFFNRHFYQYISSILGAQIDGDDMGNQANNILTIETNGNYEAEDALRICGDHFTTTNVNVITNTVDQALESKLANTYYSSHLKLAKKCIACPIKETCGGGYLPHRYSTINGFNNPSVYCEDLLKLITHVQNVVFEDINNKYNINFAKMNYEEAQNTINSNIKKISNKKYFTELENY